MSIKNKIIRKLGGVPLSEHLSYVDYLHGLLAGAQVAHVILSNTLVQGTAFDRPVLLHGENISINNAAAPSIWVSPTSRFISLIGIIIRNQSDDFSCQNIRQRDDVGGPEDQEQGGGCSIA